MNRYIYRRYVRQSRNKGGSSVQCQDQSKIPVLCTDYKTDLHFVFAGRGMSLSSGNLVEGTRVDCLFDNEYFRGTVRAPKNGLCRVFFDDGDIRDDVPPEDIAIPLYVASRVECLFEVIQGNISF